MSTSSRIDAEVLADAAAVGAQRAERVGLVDHQQGLVPLLDLDELAADRGCRRPCCRRLRSRSARGDTRGGIAPSSRSAASPIVVRERPAAGAGQDAALDDAVVRQGVVQDQVAGPNRWPITVSLVAWPPTKHDGVLGAQELRRSPAPARRGGPSRPRPAGWPRRWCRSGRWRPGPPRRPPGRPTCRGSCSCEKLINSRPSIDRAVVGDALVDGEERIAQPQRLGHVQVLLAAGRTRGTRRSGSSRSGFRRRPARSLRPRLACPDTSRPPRPPRGRFPARAGSPRGSGRRSVLPARRGSPSAPANRGPARRSASRASGRRPAPWRSARTCSSTSSATRSVPASRPACGRCFEAGVPRRRAAVGVAARSRPPCGASAWTVLAAAFGLRRLGGGERSRLRPGRAATGRPTSSVPSRYAAAAGVPLDLAAGGLGNAAGLDQHDGVDAPVRARRRRRGGWRRRPRRGVPACGARSPGRRPAARGRPPRR